MGSASAGGYINTTEGISGAAHVGDLRRTLAELACPEKEYGPAPEGPGIVFDRFSGDLVINTGSDIAWPDGTAYFHNFVRLGNGKLVVAEDDRVDLVIGGAVRVEGAGFGNDNEAAAALQLWGCGEDDRDWKIEQQGSSWMTIYAPAHRLRLTGDGVLHGSLLVGELEWVGDGTISYDAKVIDDTPFAKARGTWVELF